MRPAQYHSIEMSTQSAVQRANYVYKYMETNDQKEAREYSGLKSKKTHSRIMKRLKTYHTLEDVERPGRPHKFTAEILDEALRVLMGNVEEFFNTKQFVAFLKEENIVENDAGVYYFMAQLKTYAKQQEVRLVVGRQRMTFVLNSSHKLARRMWCRNNQDTMNEEWVKSVWWEDEIMIEEAPHPKGTCLK